MTQTSSRKFSGSYMVVDDFLPEQLADAMRADVDAHFSQPETHSASRHQVWNYWYVPELYAYLRSSPNKIIDDAKIDLFLQHLVGWSGQTLGMTKVSYPYLSLYINGCRQGLHNDASNGRFGFVYSLTKTHHRFQGGQTVLLPDENIFRRHLGHAAAGSAFQISIEPLFNRLIVFDDRVVHGVSQVEGLMDPTDARCVLHGHIEEGGPMFEGALTLDLLRGPIRAAVSQFVSNHSAAIQLCNGPLVVRFYVMQSGKVGSADVIVDRVLTQQGDQGIWEQLREQFMWLLSLTVFPKANEATAVTLPVTFGKRLPISGNDVGNVI